MVFQCGDCKYWRRNIWESSECGKCRFDELAYVYKSGSICKKFEPSTLFYSELYDLMKKAEEIGGKYYEK